MSRIQVLPVLLVMVLPAGSSAADDKNPLPELSPERVATFQRYLTDHAQPPADYVVDKFKDHDVVILGEMHWVKHQVIFVQDLLPALYKAGVFHLATEFARREDQRMVDSLLDLPDYDEALAREITFRQLVHWGYREYVDIYRAAWELNNGLPAGSRRFRILALNDSPRFELYVTQADVENDDVRNRVWKGCGEDLWAQVVIDAVKEGGKVLVYCGIHHGFTDFQHPVVDGEGELLRFWEPRMGNLLFEALGKRVITVFLHAPWPAVNGKGITYPADGTIDALFDRLGEGFGPVGFDVPGGPFADLTGENSSYSAGHERFRLADYCDGYLFFKPTSQHRGTTAIPDFVNEYNVERARRSSPYPRFRHATTWEFYRYAARDANIKRRYRHLN